MEKTAYYTIEQMCQCFNVWDDGLEFIERPSKYADLRWDEYSNRFYLGGHAYLSKIGSKDSYLFTKAFSGAVSSVSKSLSNIAYKPTEQSDVYNKISAISQIFATIINDCNVKQLDQTSLGKLKTNLEKFVNGLDQIMKGYDEKLRTDNGSVDTLIEAKLNVNNLLNRISQVSQAHEKCKIKINEEYKIKINEKMNDIYQSIKSSSKENLFLIKEDSERNRSNHIKKPVVVKLIKELENSCPQLYQVLTDERTQDDDRMIFDYSQTSYPLISPTYNGLIAYAEHYKDKYGISIDILNNDSEVSTFIQDQLKNKTERYMGVIFDPTKKGHVVPMILKFDSNGAKGIILDVLGENHQYCKYLEALLIKLEIPTSICQGPRQADPQSCRIGALVTLRNALLDLQSDKSASAIFDTAKIPSGPCTIPPKWGFTDQIFKPKVSINALKNPRQLHSKKKQKTEAPESIQISRIKYQHDLLHFDYKLILSPNSATNALDLSKLKLPPKILCSRNLNGQLTIEVLDKIQNLNIYMLYKGYKVAQYLNKLDANNSNDQAVSS